MKRACQRLALLACAALVPWACADHEPVIDRVGGPLPSYDGGALPAPDAACAEFPAEVEAVLVDKCQRCHQSPPLNGAPFPLLTWANTQAVYFDKPIYVRMYDAVSSDYMPYCSHSACANNYDPPVQPLTADQKKTLLDWLVAPVPVISCDSGSGSG